jgi:hypothetical protein
VTEREAEEKRCCGPEGCGVTTNVAPQYDVNGMICGYVHIRWCIGAKCMSWRWNNVVDGPLGPTRPSTTHGYCGLAGKP